MDGKDVRSLEVKSLRHHIAIVSQVIALRPMVGHSTEPTPGTVVLYASTLNAYGPRLLPYAPSRLRPYLVCH